jgi:hypothetical protein
MQYDAITLDSNIFHHNGFYLEGGMLGQLSQFREGSAQFVLSEIVVREVHKYLKIEAKQAKDALSQALKASSKNATLPTNALEAVKAAHDAARTPEESAKTRLKAFETETGLEVVPAHDANMKELIKRYFTPLAPFEGSGKKKNEFPDAIALLTLEAWAKAKGKKILAISKDEGWAAFAKDSEYIDVEPDLAAALQKLQEHAEQAKAHVATLLKLMDAGQKPDLLQQIIEGVADAVGELEVEPDASSAYHFETELATMTYRDMSFRQADSLYDFNIVQTGKDKIVAKVGLSIKAEAQADFSLAVWDSIDKDYVSMGSASAETEVDFEAAALITFEGDFSAAPPAVDVPELELVDAINSVDFGEVSPDYGDDYYDE